jgi:hypothetical protein
MIKKHEEVSMKKIFVTITAIIACFSTMILAQNQSEEQKKLDFLAGEWKSVSIGSMQIH